jgi:hypothetical protein
MERKWWLVIAGCITHVVNTGFSDFASKAEALPKSLDNSGGEKG